MIRGESIKFSVQLDILLLALPLGALLRITLHILRHIIIDSLKEHAYALTNHNHIIIGSSNFQTFSSAVS